MFKSMGICIALCASLFASTPTVTASPASYSVVPPSASYSADPAPHCGDVGVCLAGCGTSLAICTGVCIALGPFAPPCIASCAASAIICRAACG